MATIEISEKAEGSFSWPCFGIILPFYNKDHEMNNIPNHLLSFIDYLVAKRDMFMANDTGQWRAASGSQMQTDAQSARPLKQPG